LTHLGGSTWTALAAPGTASPILAVPIGSCEQHGPHLPLDTDTRIAVAIAEGLAVADPRVMVTPALAITASGEHQGFPGTLSVGTAVFEQVLIELVRSADWSSGVVFVNGHGGNAEAVRGAIALCTAEGREVLSWWPRVPGGDAHAGRTETSMMLAIEPTLVHLADAHAGNPAPLAELAGAMRAGGVAAVSPNGVLGDPTGASAAEGVALIQRLVADVVQQVRAWRA
jgi:mycofactocin system creatininase family protein